MRDLARYLKLGAGPMGAEITTSSAGGGGATGPTGPTGPTGGAGGGMQLIQQIVGSGSQATFHFAAIPGTYRDLILEVTGRDTSAGASDLQIRIMLNSDNVSGNYVATQYLYNNAATTASATTIAASAAGAVCGAIPGSSGLATAVGSTTIELPLYASTTFHKLIKAINLEYSGNAVTIFNQIIHAVWKNTAAITDIVITAGGTAFLDGSTATLWGRG